MLFRSFLLRLGIRARRSKNARGVYSTDSTASTDKTASPQRNPLLDHTLEDDLQDIREYAKKYMEIDERTREYLEIYVFKHKSLDYYYGSYVSAYQMFTMAFTSDNEIAPALMMLIHAISHRIVETLDCK